MHGRIRAEMILQEIALYFAQISVFSGALSILCRNKSERYFNPSFDLD